MKFIKRWKRTSKNLHRQTVLCLAEFPLMASLYGRKAKPFEYAGSSDADDFACFKKNGTSKKSASVKRTREVFTLDSDDDEANARSKVDSSPEKERIDISLENGDFDMAQVNAPVENLNPDSDNEIMVLDTSVENKKETKYSRKVKTLLKKVATAGKGPTPKKMTKAQAAANAKAAAAALNSPEVIDLDVGNDFIIPQLGNTVQLPPRYVPVKSAVDISLDRMHKLAGTKATDPGATSSSSSAHSSRVEPEKPQCRLKTRLNGSHERKWRIPMDESFGKVIFLKMIFSRSSALDTLTLPIPVTLSSIASRKVCCSVWSALDKYQISVRR